MENGTGLVAGSSRSYGTIIVDGVCKDHGHKRVVTDVSFTAEAGNVTGFLGPNGAGKSSTLRILTGLDRPTAGTATFGGVAYRDMSEPLKVVGAQFEGPGGAASRTVRTHLRICALASGINRERVGVVLDQVGMADKATARLGTLSLGEGQRIGLAAALLGDPQYIVLDEPTNGLDPGGIRWFREFVRDQAARGKTVLLSSHLLKEVEQVADKVVIIAHGSVVASGALEEMRRHLESLEDLFFAVTSPIGA